MTWTRSNKHAWDATTNFAFARAFSFIQLAHGRWRHLKRATKASLGFTRNNQIFIKFPFFIFVQPSTVSLDFCLFVHPLYLILSSRRQRSPSKHAEKWCATLPPRWWHDGANRIVRLSYFCEGDHHHTSVRHLRKRRQNNFTVHWTYTETTKTFLRYTFFDVSYHHVFSYWRRTSRRATTRGSSWSKCTLGLC